MPAPTGRRILAGKIYSTTERRLGMNCSWSHYGTKATLTLSVTLKAIIACLRSHEINYPSGLLKSEHITKSQSQPENASLSPPKIAA